MHTWNILKSFENANVLNAAQIKDLNFKIWGADQFSMGDFLVGDFNYPMTLVPPNLLGGAQALFDPVKNVIDIAKWNISVGSFATARVAAEWYNDLQSQVDEIQFAPNDYNPPRYQATTNLTTAQEVEMQQQESSEFKTKTAVTLQAYSELKQSNRSVRSQLKIQRLNLELLGQLQLSSRVNEFFQNGLWRGHVGLLFYFSADGSS